MSQHHSGDGAATDDIPDDPPLMGDDADRSRRVGDQLKMAFQALASPSVPDADRPDWHRRLIAITNSSKHDLATAETRLDRYWADWEDQIGPRPR